ncbi:11839_t:CDS:1, partial [Scutellospora calospora]
SDNELDDMLNRIFDAMDSVSQIQEIVDDDNTTEKGSSETERFKTYNLPLEEYVE